MQDKTGTSRTAWLVLAATAAVMIVGLWLRPLLPIDETRYLGVAWEMWVSGERLVPTKNYGLYPDKPPLMFWLINLVWVVTGVSEIAGRLVGPGFALLTIWLTGRLARRLWPEDATIGTRAVMALSGLVIFAFYGQLTLFDAMLAAATVATLLAALGAVQTGAWRWWALLGAGIAFGVYVKGPVIALHVGPALAAIGWWAPAAPETGRRAGRGAALAAAVALGLVGLWLVPALITGSPEYREAILWTQSAGRVSDSFAHAEPWWFYVWHLPLLGFPWLLVPGLWRGLGGLRMSEPGLRLSLAWGVGALLLFSLISGKQTHYLIPELPALALVVARVSRDVRFGLAVPALVIGAIALGAAAAGAGWIEMDDPMGIVTPRWALLPWAALLAVLALAAWRLRGLLGGLALTLGLVAAVNLLVFATRGDEVFSTHPIGMRLTALEPGGIAFIGTTYHNDFAFSGRLRKAVATPVGEAGLRAWSEAHPAGAILGRVEDGPGWAPAETVPYREHIYGIWRVEDAPASFAGLE